MRRSKILWLILAVAAWGLGGCGGGQISEPVDTASPPATKQLTMNDAVFEANPISSPDGQWILFESNASGNMDIWLMPTAGGEAEQVTFHPAYDSFPSWSPDGTGFVFESERDGTKSIWYLNLSTDGNQPMPLTDTGGDDGSPVFSPDGTLVVFESDRDRSGGTDLWQAALIGGPATRLTDTPVGVYNRTADWSPDGETLVFESNREEGTSALYTIPAKGGDVTRITQLARYEGHPSWSPDGSSIAFEATWSGSYEIWIVGAGGENPRQVTQGGGFWPCWLPDGDDIVYCAWSSGEPNIWSVHVGR